MREIHLNELRSLMPHIRQNFLTGRQVYRDQQEEVRIEDEHVRRLQKSGVQQHAGGRRLGIGDEHALRVLNRDTLVRSLHIAPDA